MVFLNAASLSVSVPVDLLVLLAEAETKRKKTRSALVAEFLRAGLLKPERLDNAPLANCTDDELQDFYEKLVNEKRVRELARQEEEQEAEQLEAEKKRVKDLLAAEREEFYTHQKFCEENAEAKKLFEEAWKEIMGRLGRGELRREEIPELQRQTRKNIFDFLTKL